MRVVVAFGDYRILRLAVIPAVACVIAFVARESYHSFRVAHEAILLLSRVATVKVPLEVFWMTHNAVSISLFVGQRAKGAVIEMVGRSAVVEGERLVRVVVTFFAADVGESVRG